MAGIEDLHNRPPEHDGLVEAIVFAAPDTVDDPLYVIVVGEDEFDHRLGPCAWMPRGATLPVEGNVCALAFTDADTPIVVAWWPDEEWPND